ncbi:LamG-like jellyroll fold domain-containing protein [Owenweeksia hongkongensis]|uniref:LamG-like jellyroll fold domain-containing protein n=1 Tax=Owenweeksia hongkongensis TaxID=253245 RepID=UPI003A8E0373
MKIKYYFFLVSFFLQLSLNAQVPGYVPTQNLRAWWSFSGNTNDLSGNGNNLTNNGATLSTDRNSNANTAYLFDGTDDFMALTNPSFAFGQDSSFTISFWSYYNQVGGWIFGHGLTQGAGGGTGKFCHFVAGTSSGDIQWRANKQGSPWLNAISPYALNAWDHWVCVYDNKVMTLYKNAVAVATQNFTYTGTQTATMPLHIGTQLTGGGTFLSGKVDDFGVWNRALTQAEITDLYNGCSATVAVQPKDVKDIVGGNVKFGVSAPNAGLTFQWQKKSGSNFQNITNGGQYSGVTTDTLEVTSLTISNNGEEYRCVVNASGCSDTSAAAVIEICGFLQMPVNQTIAVGATGAFSTKVADPSSTFQWQVDKGTGFANVYPNAQYVNPTNDTLVITGVTNALNGYKYQCVITSGACTGTSDPATLTVSNVTGLEELMDLYDIKMYPNPVQEKLHITHKGQSVNMSVAVINAVGQKVYSGHLQEGAETVLNLDFLQTGNYFVKIGDVISIPFVIKK